MADKDVLLLDPASGKPACRKEFTTLVDQTTIKGSSTSPLRVDTNVIGAMLDGSGVAYNPSTGQLDTALMHNNVGVTAGATYGEGTATSPLTVRQGNNFVTGVVELTGEAEIASEMDRNDTALTPAGLSSVLSRLKPVASNTNFSPEQLGADGIEFAILSNFSCTGGTGGAPKFDVHLEGGGVCTVDVGAWGDNSVPPPYPAGTVFGQWHDGKATGADPNHYYDNDDKFLLARRGHFTKNSKYTYGGNVAFAGSYPYLHPQLTYTATKVVDPSSGVSSYTIVFPNQIYIDDKGDLRVFTAGGGNFVVVYIGEVP